MSRIVIQKIYWKRSILNIRYSSDARHELYLSNGKKKIVFNDSEVVGAVESGAGAGEPGVSAGQSEVDANKSEYEANLNISNVKGKIMPEGVWALCSDAEITYSEDVLIGITDYDRVFRYGQGRTYLVYMNCEDDGSLLIYTSHAKHNTKPRNRSARLDLAGNVANIEYSLFHTINKEKKKKILFFSQTSSKFSDNMKPVYDRLIERGFDKEYDIDVDLREEVGKKRKIIDNIALAKKIAGYNYIFVDNYVPIFTAIKPHKDVKLIQLWHAGVGFKSVGYARFGVKGSPDAFHSCHRRYTYSMVGNEGLKSVYSEVFGISEDNMIATGMPRLENFLDKEVIDNVKSSIYSKHPILEGKRVILFAPTFRGTGQKDAYYDYDKIDLDLLKEYCEDSNSIIIFKWHGFIKDRMTIDPKYSQCMIDLSDENLNDLMYVSDVLITDYSSCYYDYLLLQRPIIFYMYDEAIYSASRGVGEKMSDIATGKVVYSMEELVGALKEPVENLPKPADYMIDMCLTNGDYKASDRIIDAVFGTNINATEIGDIK